MVQRTRGHCGLTLFILWSPGASAVVLLSPGLYRPTLKLTHDLLPGSDLKPFFVSVISELILTWGDMASPTSLRGINAMINHALLV